MRPNALYQGTTLVVPQTIKIHWALAPEVSLQGLKSVRALEPSIRHDVKSFPDSRPGLLLLRWRLLLRILRLLALTLPQPL